MSGSRRSPGRLGSHVDGYRAWLFDRGYSPGSVTRSLGALGHVGRWMDRHDIDAGGLDSDVLNAFLADHVGRYGQLPSAGLMPLLDYLRSAGVAAAEPIRRRSPLDEFLGEYRDWLAGERALSPDTVRGYTRLAHRFLAERASAEHALGVDRLTGADVTGFLLRESTRVRPGSVCCYANQLRQLLRYLSMRGFADPGLADAVPSVGRWREAGVPQFPQPPAIERMLESCDRSRRVGVRDFAILMLLARFACARWRSPASSSTTCTGGSERLRSTGRVMSAPVYGCPAMSARHLSHT
jgi:hypothetical protein